MKLERAVLGIFLAYGLTACETAALPPDGDAGERRDAGRRVDAGPRPETDAGLDPIDAGSDPIDSGGDPPLTDAGPPPPFRTGPYLHVGPADVGIHVGAGVIGDEPTEMYDGRLTIEEETTIENVIIDGCVRIEADGVVLRNVVIRCDDLYPVRVDGADDVRVEHSRIECSSHSKIFLIEDARNLVIQYNDASGCEDFFYINGDVDGMDITYNYMHHLNLTEESHADGFQIGQAANTTGTITIRGNWFSPDTSSGGRNDILFATRQSNGTIILEDNYFAFWGWFTLRCWGESTSCTAMHNVYDRTILEEGRGYYNGTSSGTHRFECNRLEGGEFPDADGVDGTVPIDDDCPPWDER
jgi:hypothetical protein